MTGHIIVAYDLSQLWHFLLLPVLVAVYPVCWAGECGLRHRSSVARNPASALSGGTGVEHSASKL